LLCFVTSIASSPHFKIRFDGKWKVRLMVDVSENWEWRFMIFVWIETLKFRVTSSDSIMTQ
jgi:hypothetical protein